VGITTTLFACTGDDSSTGTDAGSGADVAAIDSSSTVDASGQDAVSADTSAQDSSKADSMSVADSTAPVDGGSADSTANDADATLQPPMALNLCGLLDSFWDNEVRSDPTSWPLTIIDGPYGLLADGGPNPDPDVGFIGYVNVADCNVGKVFDPNSVDYGAWANQLVPFEYRFFGCPDNGADAGVGFELVPPNLYGQPFGPDDLKRLGDWYVSSVIQAVANQSANNTNALLTGDQIDQIQAEMDYQETLYPNIVAVPGYHYSTCVDAGSD
jgi:hypothetical protein